MTEFNIAIAVVGTTILVLGLLSNYFRQQWWASDPLIALIIGILVGPAVLGVVNTETWVFTSEELLEQLSRLTLAVGLMGVALRLPNRYVLRNWRSLAVLLGGVMPVMWLASGLLIYWLVGIPFWQAMLIGAVVTPTDPIVANSIVVGVVAEDNLPPRLRHLISAESGINDGLAYPFVLPSLLMIQYSPERALTDWMVQVVLKEVLGAIVLGLVIGYLAGWLLEKAERSQLIERTSFLGYSLALSIMVLGVTKLSGTDGILAVFVAGLAFRWQVNGSDHAEEENVQEALDRFFTLPVFVLLGVLLPWQAWQALGWPTVIGVAIALLLLRRIPALLLFGRWINPLRHLTERIYVGWFGPIGVAALFNATYATRETEIEIILPLSMALVCASVVAQGLSASPLTKQYGARYYRHSDQETA